jgi:hypothetical protein
VGRSELQNLARCVGCLYRTCQPFLFLMGGRTCSSSDQMTVSSTISGIPAATTASAHADLTLLTYHKRGRSSDRIRPQQEIVKWEKASDMGTAELAGFRPFHSFSCLFLFHHRHQAVESSLVDSICSTHAQNARYHSSQTMSHLGIVS